ncbi:MAG TPA: hypothetical protein PLS93_14310 [Accumulibacter sp.]|nr:hypothetical protein [Accumulibacter sp.]
MKKSLTAIAITASLALVAAAATHQYRQSAAAEYHQSDLLSRLHVVEHRVDLSSDPMHGQSSS